MTKIQEREKEAAVEELFTKIVWRRRGRRHYGLKIEQHIINMEKRVLWYRRNNVSLHVFSFGVFGLLAMGSLSLCLSLPRCLNAASNNLWFVFNWMIALPRPGTASRCYLRKRCLTIISHLTTHTHKHASIFHCPLLSLSLFLPRVQRGVSMETRTRQWSVFKPKVHSVREGGSTEILQQAGCKWDKCSWASWCSKAILENKIECSLVASTSRLGIQKRWWKSRPSMLPSSRLRLATLAACKSPTWKTTAQGTSLSTTAMLRYAVKQSISYRLFLIHSLMETIVILELI